MVKNLPGTAGNIRNTDSISGLGSSPRGGHGNPLQYSCLENPWTEEPARLQSAAAAAAASLQSCPTL